MDSQFIHLNREDWDKPVYRYTDIRWALKLFISKSNTLRAPWKWDDPFENLLGQTQIGLSNGKTAKYPFRYSMFGQCWTLAEEQDAFWRIYVPSKTGVRLQSTVRHLAVSLFNGRVLLQSGIEECKSYSGYIGRVQYYPFEDLENKFSDPTWMKANAKPGSYEGEAKSMLFKRAEFLYEQEIRLLFNEPRNNCQETDGSPIGHLDYVCDPNRLVLAITFDPRMDEHMIAFYSDNFRRLGFTGDIGTSTLYRPPKLINPSWILESTDEGR